MPQTKHEWARRSNEEIENFFDCGDARGPQYLDAHPEAREEASRHLRDLPPRQGRREHP